MPPPSPLIFHHILHTYREQVKKKQTLSEFSNLKIKKVTKTESRSSVILQ